MIFNKYPYTDFHELNLDWILGEIRRLTHAMSDFEAANHIKPCGVWDITKQYEAWSVVTDGGKGYISTRPVPVGIAISNQDYWTEIVDYDAFWGTLNLRVQVLENSMSTLTGTTIPGIQNDVSGLDGRLDTLEGTTIPGLDGRINTLENTTIPSIQSEITSVQNDVSLMKNKKIIFIADSYAGTSDFVTKVNSIMGWTAGVDSFCNAVGGEGFIEGNGGNGFLDELQQHAGNMTAAVRNSITDIMVIGGANDAKTNQIYGANPMENHFIDFVNYAVANFPNAKIHVGFIGVCKFSSSTLENRTQDNLEICAYHYRDMALKYGCAYMTYVEYATRWMAGLTLNADGLHPNSSGGVIIANAIINYIKNHGISTSISRYDCVTSSVIGGGNLKMVYSMMNNQASIECGQIAVTNFTGNITGGDADTPFNDRTHIADYQGIFVNRDLHVLTFAFCPGISPYVFPIDILFQGTNISATALRADGTGWRDITWSNAVMVIAPFSISFDPIIMA